MRKIWAMAAGLAALAAAGCDGDVNASTRIIDENGVRVSASTTETDRSRFKVASRLECPEREGKLRLASSAADGRSCTYRSRDGEAQVELRLAALNGPAEAHLRPLEADLKLLVPSAAAAAASPPPAPPAPPGVGAAADGERTQVRMPGLQVDAQGDRASVRLPGVTINADDRNADIRVRGDDGESVTVRATDDGAEIRTVEAKARARGDFSSTYLLASETAGPGGWRVAGYRAQGPSAGPLVIGVLRAQGRRDDNLMDEVEELIERNVER